MLAYLQLIRLPTVFTTMADIILGYSLTHRCVVGPNGWKDPQAFFGLLAASCCLYLSGMVFNDVFDRKQDAAERPGRPIPSGRVTLKSAVILGAALMIAGLVAAALVGRISLQVAGLLVVAILAYDGILKRTPLGPLAMGSCRFLNVLMGASAHQNLFLAGLMAPPQAWAAAGLGIYIVGVTVFARTEAKSSSRWQLGLAQLLFNGGIAVLAALIVFWPVWEWPPRRNGPMALGMLAVVAFTLNRRAFTSIVDPSPQNVQLTVKLLLLSYVMLDATVIYWNLWEEGSYGTAHALVTALLIVPAMLLSRYIRMT